MKKLEFKIPPLNEVVLGLEYLSNFEHTFLTESNFYNEIKSNYPIIERKPPIFRGSDIPSSILNNQNPRHFFISNKKERLFQLQEGRFFHNWRKLTSHNISYPRFSDVYKEFESKWEVFKDKGINDENIKITGLELTYINNIDFQQKNIQSIANLLSFLGNPDFLSSESRLNINMSFPTDNCNGDVLVKLNKAQRRDNKKEIYIFEIHVLGSLNEGITIKDWFEYAHDEVMDYFLKGITDKAKTLWGYNESNA